jgi:hypothetical protein
MKTASIVLALALAALPVVAHEGGHDVRGVAISVGSQELTVKTSRGEEKFVLTPETQFVNNGSPATVQDLKASDRVVVHAKKSGGPMEAVKVEFRSAKTPKKP